MIIVKQGEFCRRQKTSQTIASRMASISVDSRPLSLRGKRVAILLQTKARRALKAARNRRLMQRMKKSLPTTRWNESLDPVLSASVRHLSSGKTSTLCSLSQRCTPTTFITITRLPKAVKKTRTSQTPPTKMTSHKLRKRTKIELSRSQPQLLKLSKRRRKVPVVRDRSRQILKKAPKRA